jgi:hypothetical protein
MAVVTKYGQGYQSPSSRLLPEAIYRGNPVRSILASIAIANGDSATSTLLIAKLPSHAIFVPGGLITHSAITGLTDFDLGFGEDADCLADGLTLAAAGTKNPLASVAVADLLKPAWQLAGLSRDPGREMTLTATLKVDAGAAGTAHFYVPYVGKL